MGLLGGMGPGNKVSHGSKASVVTVKGICEYASSVNVSYTTVSVNHGTPTPGSSPRKHKDEVPHISMAKRCQTNFNEVEERSKGFGYGNMIAG